MSSYYKNSNSRVQSIKCALEGLKLVWLTEKNFKIHIFISIFLFVGAIVFKIDKLEWGAIFLSTILVKSAELWNTVVEHICDINCDETSPKVKVIKDMSAANVLFVGIVVTIINFTIFIPKFFHIIS